MHFTYRLKKKSFNFVYNNLNILFIFQQDSSGRDCFEAGAEFNVTTSIENVSFFKKLLKEI